MGKHDSTVAMGCTKCPPSVLSFLSYASRSRSSARQRPACSLPHCALASSSSACSFRAARRLRRVEGLGVVPEAHFLHRGRDVVEVVVRAEGELRSRDGGLGVSGARFLVFAFLVFAKKSFSRRNRRRFQILASVLSSRRGVSFARTSVVCERLERERDAGPELGPGGVHRRAPSRRTSSSPLVNGLSIRGVELSSLAPAEAWNELVLIFAGSSRAARPGSRLTPELGWCDPTRGVEHRVASQ